MDNFLYQGSLIVERGESVKDKILLELTRKGLKPLGEIIIRYPSSQLFPDALFYLYTVLVMEIEKEEKWMGHQTRYSRMMKYGADDYSADDSCLFCGEGHNFGHYFEGTQNDAGHYMVEGWLAIEYLAGCYVWLCPECRLKIKGGK